MVTTDTVDPRRQRSRDSMEAATRELIEERGLAGVTVAAVTTRAGVSRSTFYDHYESLDDLVEQACTVMFDALLAETPVYAVEPRSNPLAALFDHVLAHRTLYTALLVEGGSARVHLHLHQRMTVAVHVNRNADEPGITHRGDPPESPHDVAATMAAGAMLGAVVDWLRRGCPGEPDEVASEAWQVLVELLPRLSADPSGADAPATTRRPTSRGPSLEERLRRVEDELEIRQLIMVYGPAADAGLADEAASRWTSDGLYDWDAAQAPKEGRTAVAKMLEGAFHHQLMGEGVAHFAGPLLIDLDGDKATALNYSLIMRKGEDSFYLWRVSAVRWDLQRDNGAWRVRRRTNRLLDESGVGSALFGETVRELFEGNLS